MGFLCACSTKNNASISKTALTSIMHFEFLGVLDKKRSLCVCSVGAEGVAKCGQELCVQTLEGSDIPNKRSHVAREGQKF